MENYEKFVIKWRDISDEIKSKIKLRFNIPDYTTLNGESPALIKREDIEIFRETARRGFFSILPIKWCKNGASFAFISC